MFSAPCSILKHQWGIVQPAQALSWSVELQGKSESLAFSKQVNTSLTQKGKTKYNIHQQIDILEGSRNDWFVHPRCRTYDIFHVVYSTLRWLSKYTHSFAQNVGHVGAIYVFVMSYSAARDTENILFRNGVLAKRQNGKGETQENKRDAKAVERQSGKAVNGERPKRTGRPSSIRGFDYNFTNYTFKITLNFKKITLELHPSGNICSKQIIKGFF